MCVCFSLSSGPITVSGTSAIDCSNASRILLFTCNGRRLIAFQFHAERNKNPPGDVSRRVTDPTLPTLNHRCHRLRQPLRSPPPPDLILRRPALRSPPAGRSQSPAPGRSQSPAGGPWIPAARPISVSVAR